MNRKTILLAAGTGLLATLAIACSFRHDLAAFVNQEAIRSIATSPSHLIDTSSPADLLQPHENAGGAPFFMPAYRPALPTAPAATTDWPEFTSRQYSISFEYPPSWSLAPMGSTAGRYQGQYVADFYDSDTTTTDPTLEITFHPAPGISETEFENTYNLPATDTLWIWHTQYSGESTFWRSEDDGETLTETIDILIPGSGIYELTSDGIPPEEDNAAYPAQALFRSEEKGLLDSLRF
jgi:hypothetical protein